MLVPNPPGLDAATHNFVGGSLPSTPGGHFPRHAGEDFHAHTQVASEYPCIGPIEGEQDPVGTSNNMVYYACVICIIFCIMRIKDIMYYAYIICIILGIMRV